MKHNLNRFVIALTFLSITACQPITLGKVKAPLASETAKEKIGNLRSQNGTLTLELQTLKSCLRMLTLQTKVNKKIIAAQTGKVPNVKGYQESIVSIDNFIKRYNCNDIVSDIVNNPIR